jgi:dipeptidyl aminopeptidase/acylaminoacyl peptidase
MKRWRDSTMINLRRKLLWGLLGTLVLLPSPSLSKAQETHPFNVHDLWDLDRISDPQVSPDGNWIVFGLSSLDIYENRRRSDLWMVGVDGTSLRQLTTSPAGEFNARWAPDGSGVFFLSTRSGNSQVWHIALAGGEAQQVTHLPLGVGSMAISPEGTHVAVSMEVFPDCPDLACSVSRLDQASGAQSSGVLYDELFIRHWDTWEDGRRSHIFVLPVKGSGAPVDVMAGMKGDSPSVPFGGPEEYTFTPDGTAVVFTARMAGGAEPWSTDFDLYVAPIDGSHEPQLLTTENRAWDTQPVFSPDGETLAYLAMERPGFEAPASWRGCPYRRRATP